jgi:hypothetical protein
MTLDLRTEVEVWSAVVADDSWQANDHLHQEVVIQIITHLVRDWLGATPEFDETVAQALAECFVRLPENSVEQAYLAIGAPLRNDPGQQLAQQLLKRGIDMNARLAVCMQRLSTALPADHPNTQVLRSVVTRIPAEHLIQQGAVTVDQRIRRNRHIGQP